jgi:hypothetical protein
LSNHQKSISGGQKSSLEGSKTAKILVRSDPETSEIDKSDSRGSKIVKILFSDRQRRSWPDRPEVNRAPGPRKERSGGRGPGVRNRLISCEGLDQKFSGKVSNVRRSDSQSGLRIEKRLRSNAPKRQSDPRRRLLGDFPRNFQHHRTEAPRAETRRSRSRGPGRCVEVWRSAKQPLGCWDPKFQTPSRTECCPVKFGFGAWCAFRPFVSSVRRSDSQSGLRIEKRLAAMSPNDRVIHAGGFWGIFPATSSIIVPRPPGPRRDEVEVEARVDVSRFGDQPNSPWVAGTPNSKHLTERSDVQ